MTPFDPNALLAMLLAFYPDVSGAFLQLARDERPEYFAGGTLIGRQGDVLVLPDGRAFDLIFAAGDPAQRWQVLDITNLQRGDVEPDPFPLEDGPLTPIDELRWPLPRRRDEFTSFTVDALAELGDSDAILGAAASTLAEASSPAAFDQAVSGAIGDADDARAQQQAAAAAAAPADVLETTSASLGETFGGEGDAEFDPPPPLSADDPGPVPVDDSNAPGTGYTDDQGVDKIT